MDPATATLIASGITAGGNLFSQIFTNQANRRSEADARAFNVRQQELMNQFNSPVQQVQRLRAAGLNPALAYGGNGELVGNQPSPVVGNPVVNQAPQADYSGVINAALAVREQQNRNSLADAEVSLKNAYTLSETFKQAKYDIDTQVGRENLRQLELFLNPRLAKIQSEIDLNEELKRTNQTQQHLNETRCKLDSAQASLVRTNEKIALETLPYTIKHLNAETAMLYMQSEKFANDMQLGWAQLANDQRRVAEYARSIGINAEFTKTGQLLEAESIKQRYVSDAIRGITTICTLGMGGILAGAKRSNTEQSVLYQPNRTSEFGTNWNKPNLIY